MRIRRTNYLLAGLPRFAFPKSAAILCELLDGSADVLLLDTLSETARTLSKTPLGEDALVTDGTCVHGLVQVRARCTYAGERLVERAFHDFGARLAGARLVRRDPATATAAEAQGLSDLQNLFFVRGAEEVVAVVVQRLGKRVSGPLTKKLSLGVRPRSEKFTPEPPGAGSVEGQAARALRHFAKFESMNLLDDYSIDDY